jgi:hypothetical protein
VSFELLGSAISIEPILVSSHDASRVDEGFRCLVTVQWTEASMTLL